MPFVEATKMLLREVEDKTPAPGLAVLLFVSQLQCSLAWSLKGTKHNCTLRGGNSTTLVLRIGWKLLAFTSLLSCVGEDQNWQDRVCLRAGSLETHITQTSPGLIEIETRSSHKQTWLLVTVVVTCQVVTQSSRLTESAYRKVVTSIEKDVKFQTLSWKFSKLFVPHFQSLGLLLLLY